MRESYASSYPDLLLDALRDLIDECNDTSQLQVAVRWDASDLVSGASDVEIYPYFKRKEHFLVSPHVDALETACL